MLLHGLQERDAWPILLGRFEVPRIACEKHGDKITLTCMKQKDADKFAPISFRTRKVRHGEVESLVLDHVEDGKQTVERLCPDAEAMRAQLTAAYPATPPATQRSRESSGARPAIAR